MNKVVILIVVVCFGLSLILTPFLLKTFRLDLSEPVTGQYTSDELSFLKTFYLMEKGDAYYSAFKWARYGLGSPDNLSADSFVWRMPTIFLIWSFVANSAQQIFWLFIFLALLFCVASFLLIKKFIKSNYAIIAPVLLIFYFLDSLRYKTAYLFTEWWGLFFFLFGLTFYIYKSHLLAILFLSLAGLTRELFVIPIILLMIYAFGVKKNYQVYLFSIIIFGLFYLVHKFQISEVITSTVQSNLLSRIHSFSWVDLQRMLSFSMRNFVFFGMKTHLVLVGMGIISVVVSLLINFRKDTTFLTLPVLAFLLFLPLVSVYDNDYWGILFVPLLLISIPLLFSLKLKR